jgi:hypothetical protein
VKRIFVTILLCLGVSHVSGYIDILIWWFLCWWQTHNNSFTPCTCACIVLITKYHYTSIICIMTQSDRCLAVWEYHNNNIPYSRKFSWGPIFAVFTDKLLSAKIRPTK